MFDKLKQSAIIRPSFAANGTGHWWLQRLTAVALIPLSYWLLVLLDTSINGSYQQTLDWLSSPINTLAMMLWVIGVCYHSALGLQVVIEDYIPTESIQKWSILGVQIMMSIITMASLTALIQIFIAG